MDTNEINDAIKDGIREGIKSRVSQSYGPVAKKLDAIIDDRVTPCLTEAVDACFADPAFRSEIAAGVREVLGKTLVRRFGGDLERHINALKSDPKTRDRIVDALDKIVQQQDPSPVQPVQGAGAESVA